MSTNALLQRRLVLVTGKGGVGKSTCAVGLALAACREGKRVLLAEIGARAISSDYLSGAKPSHDPSQPMPERHPELWISHLDPQRSLQEYLIEQLHAPRLVKLATENRVLSRLWQAAPSVNEMSLLNTLYQHTQARLADGRPRFDLVIVDMPATGHALAMLGVPRGGFGMVRVGHLAGRLSDIDALLHDPAASAVCIVTLPEELAVNESVQLAERLHDIGITPSHVVINRVLPELFESDEWHLLQRLTGVVELGPGRKLLDVAARGEGRRRLQARRILDLKGRLKADFIEIASLGRRGFALASEVADALLGRPGIETARPGRLG